MALSTASVLGGSSSYGPPGQDFGAPIGVLGGGGGGGYDESSNAGGQVHRHVSIMYILLAGSTFMVNWVQNVIFILLTQVYIHVAPDE